jgi:hypothetical protein
MAVYTFAIILKKSLPGTDEGVRGVEALFDQGISK